MDSCILISMQRISRRVLCASKCEADLASIMEDVLFEMKQKTRKGSKEINVGEVHLRAHELLYEKQNGKKPPSSNKCFVVLVPQAARGECQQLVSLEHCFPGCRWGREKMLLSQEFDELFDASDEYMYFEVSLMRYLRENSLELGRSLPLLREAWCHIFSRLRGAEERFITARRALFATKDISPEWYKKTEERIDYVHRFVLAAHRTLFLSNSRDFPDAIDEVLDKVLSFSSKDFLSYVEKVKKEREGVLFEIF